MSGGGCFALTDNKVNLGKVQCVSEGQGLVLVTFPIDNYSYIYRYWHGISMACISLSNCYTPTTLRIWQVLGRYPEYSFTYYKCTLSYVLGNDVL